MDAELGKRDGEDTNNDGIIIGVNLNGDGDFNDWVGIDEGLKVREETYWDDELAGDLNTLSYAKLIFVRQGCVEGNQSCFGGGLIDDISASSRIIMTATNETWYSYGDVDDPGEPGYGYSEWSEAFIDALHGEDTYWNGSAVVHTGIEVDADVDNNLRVSMWEAWDYAWNHDDARLLGLETPWLDDNGNGLPTYINGSETLDENDGWLASCTYLARL